MGFRILLPGAWSGRLEGAVVSEHPTVDAAFSAIDRMGNELAQNGARRDALPLVVIDECGRVVRRRGTH